MINIYILLFINSCISSKDPSIGITSWGTVKIPMKPIEISYTLLEQEMTYNILVSSLMASSPKKVMDELALDLSKIRWADSGEPMFNVTLLTEAENLVVIGKKSETFHPYVIGTNLSTYYKPGKIPPLIPRELKKHENRLTKILVNNEQDNEHTVALR